MQQQRQRSIPPYGSAEYITGGVSNINVNNNGYNNSNNGYSRSTRPDAGPRAMSQQGGLPPPNLSIQAQPGTPRPPSAYSETSTLPYLQGDSLPPPPPVPPMPPMPTARPQSSPFPRFVPPPTAWVPQPNSAPTSPGSAYPPRVDYHSQALAVVGAHPSSSPRRERPAFYPAMMRPQNSIPGRSEVPVEAVMARYGQALPDEPSTTAPIFPRAESNPMPSRQASSRKRLSRPQHERRTQSDSPLTPSPPPQPPQPQYPPQAQQPVEEEKKKPGSMLRKLTKKRPSSMPTDGRGKTDPRFESPQDPLHRPEILPDVLFHVRTTQDYEMQSYEELNFSAGAIIAVKSAPENGRWTGYVVDSLGPRKDEGIFYRTFVSLLQRVDSSRARGNILFMVEAVYSYRAAREDEFDFSAGDTIAVYSTPQGPYWVGVNERSTNPRAKMFPWKIVAPK